MQLYNTTTTKPRNRQKCEDYKQTMERIGKPYGTTYTVRQSQKARKLDGIKSSMTYKPRIFGYTRYGYRIRTNVPIVEQ
jgi:hypothetical protein